jgi:uncharacterized Zn finger protein
VSDLGQRFLAALESLGMASRLKQGRLAARSGAVLSMSLTTSVVIAQVRGEGAETYRCRIGVKAFERSEWSRVERTLAGQAIHVAKLLAGEVPDEVFTEVGLRLFPTDMRELAMDCTCVTWDVPCQHLAAVCQLLAESFDQDPFQVLAWRGRGRDDLLSRLGELRGRKREPPPMTGFWRRQSPVVVGAAEPIDRPDAVLDELDALPLELRGQRVTDLLRPAYQAMAVTRRPGPARS